MPGWALTQAPNPGRTAREFIVFGYALLVSASLISLGVLVHDHARHDAIWYYLLDSLALCFAMFAWWGLAGVFSKHVADGVLARRALRALAASAVIGGVALLSNAPRHFSSVVDDMDYVRIAAAIPLGIGFWKLGGLMTRQGNMKPNS